jgi:Zn-dependent protease
MAFIIILLGWVFSVCLHEFAHAGVAYLGGDKTVRDKGYLTFNPLRYIDPMYSIALPVLFLMMGGMGLPGAAVYIDKSRLKNDYWESAVSLAGPAANALLALLIGLLLQSDQVLISPVGAPIASLGLLQVSSVIISLIPIPPLDGFGVVEPFLPHAVVAKGRQYANIGIWVVVICLFYVHPLNRSFWNATYWLCDHVGIPPSVGIQGLHQFRFWRG